MYTFTTKKFEISAIRRASDAGEATLDSEVLDNILEARFEQRNRGMQAHQAASHTMFMDTLREYQSRFFATFRRPIPDDAVAHPLGFWDDAHRLVLFSGEYGYSMSSAHPIHERVWDPDVAFEACCVQNGSVQPCDEARVAPWLADLVREFGRGMVFHAALGLAHYAPGIHAVCRKYDLPLSTVRFSKAAKQDEMFTFHMRVDGATVPLYQTHRGLVEHPERLTPWSRALLNHPREQAILLEIARVLNSE